MPISHNRTNSCKSAFMWCLCLSRNTWSPHNAGANWVCTRGCTSRQSGDMWTTTMTLRNDSRTNNREADRHCQTKHHRRVLTQESTKQSDKTIICGGVKVVMTAGAQRTFCERGESESDQPLSLLSHCSAGNCSSHGASTRFNSLLPAASL